MFPSCLKSVFKLTQNAFQVTSLFISYNGYLAHWWKTKGASHNEFCLWMNACTGVQTQDTSELIAIVLTIWAIAARALTRKLKSWTEPIPTYKQSCLEQFSFLQQYFQTFSAADASE